MIFLNDGPIMERPFLFQLVSEDLPRRIPGEGVRQNRRIWDLVARQIPPTIFEEFLCRHLLPGFQDNRGMNPLSPGLVGDSIDSRFQDFGMPVENILYFLGIDIFPATDDHVVLSFNNVEKPVFIKAAQVLGVQPPIP